MTYFKLDIPKIGDCISQYKLSKKNYIEDLNYVFSGLAYTQSAWNDANTSIFLAKTKSDKIKILDYFEYLDSLCNEINLFKSNIDSICCRYGYRRNGVVLKFDDNQINDCKERLKRVKNYLNIALNKINVNSFDSDFENLNSVYNLKYEIRNMITMVNELLSDIDNFVNSINNEINDSKFRMKKIGEFNFNLKVASYKGKIVDK